MIQIFPVTQNYIDGGDRCSPANCPIAMAGDDALPVGLEVYQNRIEVYQYASRGDVTYGVSGELSDWITRFDDGEEVDPIVVAMDSETLQAYIVEVTV